MNLRTIARGFFAMCARGLSLLGMSSSSHCLSQVSRAL